MRLVILESPYAGDVERNTPGMHEGIARALREGRPFEYRKLGSTWGQLGASLIREGFNL